MEENNQNTSNSKETESKKEVPVIRKANKVAKEHAEKDNKKKKDDEEYPDILSVTKTFSRQNSDNEKEENP